MARYFFAFRQFLHILPRTVSVENSCLITVSVNSTSFTTGYDLLLSLSSLTLAMLSKIWFQDGPFYQNG